jgi:hypothetical protein
MKIFFSFLIIAVFITTNSCDKGTASPPAATFYLINASEGSQSLDISIDGTSVKNGLVYGEDSGYYSTSPGIHRLQIARSGSGANLIDINVSLTAAQAHSIFMIDTITNFTSVILIDTIGSAPKGDTAKLRFLNFCVKSPTLTARFSQPWNDTFRYINYPSRTFNDQRTSASRAAFIKIVAGPYDLNLLNITNPTDSTSDTTIVKSFPGITFTPGKIYTLFLEGVYTDTAKYPITAKLIENN